MERAVSLAGSGRRQKLAKWCHSAGVLPMAGRFRDAFKDDFRILAYHRVLESVDPESFRFDLELISASAENFREQMSLIKRKFNPIRFDELTDCIDRGRAPPPRSILVTFDDGYDDNYRVAFPILRDLDMSAMFFVSTGHIESGMPYAYDWLVHMVCTTSASDLAIPEIDVAWQLPDSLDARRGSAARLLEILKNHSALVQESVMESLQNQWNMPRVPHADCRPMTWEQLREMRDGGMELGSHGVHHRMLAKLPAQLMTEEVIDSKSMLDHNLGGSAQVLSYPVGGFNAYDHAVVEATRSAGFRMACSYVSGTNRLQLDSSYSLRRLHVERGVDAAWFQGMLELPEIFSYRTNAFTG